MSIPSLPNSLPRFRRISHASSRFSYDAIWSAVEEKVNNDFGSVSSYHRMRMQVGSFQTDFVGKSFSVGFSPFENATVDVLNCTVDDTPLHGSDCVQRVLPPGQHRVKWNMWTNANFVEKFRLYHLDYEPIKTADEDFLADVNSTVVLNPHDKNVTWGDGWERTTTNETVLIAPNASFTVTFTGIGIEWNSRRETSEPKPEYSLDGSELVEVEWNSLKLQDLCYQTHNLTIHFPLHTASDNLTFGSLIRFPPLPQDLFQIHLPSAESDFIRCEVVDAVLMTNDGPLSAGQLVGVAVAAVLVVLIFIAGAALCIWRKRRRRHNQTTPIPFFEKPTTFGTPLSSKGSLASSIPSSSIRRPGTQVPVISTHSFQPSLSSAPTISVPNLKARQLPSSPSASLPSDLPPKVPMARPLPTEPANEDSNAPASVATSVPAIQHVDSGLRLATTDTSLPSRTELPPLYSAT